MKKRRKPGQPTKYRPIYCKKIIKFFDKPSTRTVNETFYYKNGDEKVKEIEVPNELPTIDLFAMSIGVDDTTLLNWGKKHKEFFAAYQKAKKLQENIWLQNSLRGLYPSQFAIFIGKNVFDYKDKTEQDINEKVTIVEEQPK